MHNKYRPKSFDEIIGHAAIVASLKAAVEKDVHAFLFVGPAGIGKTTLARIVASALGVTPDGIEERNGAAVGKVDDMRKLLDRVPFFSMSANGKKAIIIDEAQRLSKEAFDALLKPLEEPPQHVYWFICSSDPAKIPDTIKTRCNVYTLPLLGPQDIEKVIRRAAEGEKKALPAFLTPLLVAYSRLSARRALTGLQMVIDCATEEEVRALLKQIPDAPGAYEFATALCKGQITFDSLFSWMKTLAEENNEATRITVYRTANGFAKNGSMHALTVLDYFQQPCWEQNGMGDIMIMTARVLKGKK